MQFLIISSSAIHRKKDFESAHKCGACGRFATQMGHHPTDNYLLDLKFVERILKRSLMESVVLCFV